MSQNLNEILRHFDIQNSVERYGSGHINETYLVQEQHRYILQKISPIFDPEMVMSNIANVTEHLSKKILAAGGAAILLLGVVVGIIVPAHKQKKFRDRQKRHG